MTRLPILAALVFSWAVPGRQAPPSPDSTAQTGAPKGELLKFSFEGSRIFPGTYRDYWIYVPAQYSPDKPACLYVNQDGVQWNAPTVFDNLIHKKEMPITVGVFVMHGRVRAAEAEKALDRFNRSYEYDGLGDGYARFLIEELLPEVESKKTSDGRVIRLSKEPGDRAIGGSSSGAIAAFTAAWERPDSFSRVFSAIGTYVGLRGGDRYPTLVRKFEPKPLRIFLQGGSNDLNIYAGDWWMANQMMERALTFSGYEVTHAWGEGGHSNQHGTTVFPDAMRWLWKGWPASVKAGISRNAMLNEILIPTEAWQPVTSSAGLDNLPLRSVSSALPGTLAHTAVKGPQGGTYRISGRDLTVVESTGRTRKLASFAAPSRVAVGSNGHSYVTEPGKVWLVRADRKKMLVDTGIESPQALTLSSDQTLLYLADSESHWVYSFQIQPDGTLKHKQKYYWLHSPDDSTDSGANSMCVDEHGRVYVATRLGIQVCDQAGRVNCILPVPGGYSTAVAFGGSDLQTLYARTGDNLYARRLKVKGAPAWAAPVKPAPPRL